MPLADLHCTAQAELQLLLLLIRKNICCAPKKNKNNIVENWRIPTERQHRLTSISGSASMDANEPRPAQAAAEAEPACFLIRTWP